MMQYGNKQVLRDVLKTGKQMLVPCVYDCISAKAMEQCGFDAVLISDGALSYTLGRTPTADEMIEMTASIARAVSIPVVVDAGDGQAESPDGVYHVVKSIGPGWGHGLHH